MDSWLRKFDRAEEHLKTIKAMLGGAEAGHTYPVSKGFETHHERREWVYRLDLTSESELDEALPIVGGEFLFNVRSGLDHRAVSLVPANQKHRAYFPIFADDPFPTQPHRPTEHVNKEAWKAWKGAISRFPPSAREVLIDLQPFKVAPQRGEPAEHHSLDILRRLNDADKHKELFVAERGVTQVDVVVNGIIDHTFGADRVLKHGAVAHTSKYKMDVQVIGAPCVTLGIAQDGPDKRRWPLPLTFDSILDHIAQTVLPALEGLLVYPDSWAN